jgi:hypothetical protein
MKHLKKYEKYSGKFILDRKPDDKIDNTLIHKKLSVDDWIEYYFTYLSYSQNKTTFVKEIGQIVKKDDPNVDLDIIVKPLNPTIKSELWQTGERPIRSHHIIRKLKQYEIDSIKYNI